MSITVYAKGLTVEVLDNAVIVPPPPPPPVGGFKSVSKIGTDAYAPKAGTAGSQPVQMQLHGYGGDSYSFGDSYSAVCNAAMGYADNLPFYFHVQNTDNFLGLNPKIEIQPMDRVVKPTGGYMTSLFFGYNDGVPKKACDYTYRILDALYDWTFANHPQASKTRVCLYGGSMGAWACLHYGLRRPTKFAAVFASLPRWRLTSLSDLALGTWVEQGSLSMSDGSGTYAQHNDMIAYVSNPANKLPFLSCAIGRNDPYGLWAEQVEAIAALRATKRAFVYSWNNGNHSDGALSEAAIKATYNRESFELGKGYPVLMNSSLDSPLTDLVGGINLGFKWRNVVESALGWSCEISNANGAVTVDVLPHSDVFAKTVAAKTVSIPAGTWVAVSFT